MTTPPQRDVEQEAREAREVLHYCGMQIVAGIPPVGGFKPHIPETCGRCQKMDRFESAVRAAALREAHDSGCHCHHSMPVLADVDGKCTSSVGGLLCGQPISLHEHTDPRCERLRDGK